MVRSAYTFEAARGLTASMVDEGQKPAVISALLKYRTTEAMRDRINDAIDIHGGRAVQDGPSNYLFCRLHDDARRDHRRGRQHPDAHADHLRAGRAAGAPLSLRRDRGGAGPRPPARRAGVRRGLRRACQLHAAQHDRQLPARAELRALRLDARAARDGALVPRSWRATRRALRWSATGRWRSSAATSSASSGFRAAWPTSSPTSTCCRPC